jgi:hypothetical protein
MAILALPLLYQDVAFPVGTALLRRVNGRPYRNLVCKVAVGRVTPSNFPLDFTQGLEDLGRLRAVRLSDGAPANRRYGVRA